MTTLAIICVVLIFLILLAIIIREANDMQPYYDDEEETVTTTTTTTTTTVTDSAPVDDTIYVVGNLKRSFEGKQPFVLDPVDGEKCWLNDRDDLYEDADGKIWKLV